MLGTPSDNHTHPRFYMHFSYSLIVGRYVAMGTNDFRTWRHTVLIDKIRRASAEV